MTRALIVVADSLGVTEAMTSGGLAAIRGGLASSGRIVVVGAWAKEVARRYEGEDLGVEAVLTSPNPVLGYRPLTYAPTLMGGDGTFPTTVDDLLEHADANETYAELRAQLERAILWGVGISHLSVLSDAVWPRADLADAVLQLAQEFHLALSITHRLNETLLGYDAYGLACQRGITTPSRILRPGSQPLAAVLKDTLTSRDPAPISNDEVIELAATFAIDSPELRAYGTEGIQIIDGGQLTAQSASLATLLADLGVKASPYRDLLDKLPTNT
ncbi:MAG: ChbG/HpnK family deacetylase [Ferrimicrobium sp.]|nr:ChbG/HpnK family deacetylase [Ferrimicrobium sp.]